MATDVGVPATFQYKFLKSEITNGGGLPMPLTPPLTGQRRQSVESPLVRPRPRAGSDSSRYQRLSENLNLQRGSSPTTNGSPRVGSRGPSTEREYKPVNSSPLNAGRQSLGSFPGETADAAAPHVKAAFTYQKLEDGSKTGEDEFDFTDWHFNQPNVFLDSGMEKQAKAFDAAAPSMDAVQCEVVSRFICRHDDEIDLSVGDKISVTAKYPDLWFHGINLATGKQGVFPSLYVKELPKPVIELPKTENNPLVSLNEVAPPVPKRLGSLNKQMSEPALLLSAQAKPEEMLTIFETHDETQSVPPRLAKPPVIARVKSPQTSLQSGWVSLDEGNLSSDMDSDGYSALKKDSRPGSKFPAPVQAAKATSTSPTNSAVVSASDAVAKPPPKVSGLIVEDNESDYSEVKFSVLDFEKLTKKVGAVSESSTKDEGAQAILDAAKSPTKEAKMEFSEDYEDLSLNPSTFEKLQRKVQAAEVIGKRKLSSPEGLGAATTQPVSVSAKSDDGIITPKEVTGGLKVKETNRNVFYARLLGCVQVKRHRGSGALRDAIAKIQKEREAFGVADKKPCIIEISEKGFSLHDNTESMEPRDPLVYSLFRVISCANLSGSDKVFGVYIKDAEQEVYHCYAFEAEGSNKEVAVAFGDAFKRFYKQLMRKKAAQKQQKK